MFYKDNVGYKGFSIEIIRNVTLEKLGTSFYSILVYVL